MTSYHCMWWASPRVSGNLHRLLQLDGRVTSRRCHGDSTGCDVTTSLGKQVRENNRLHDYTGHCPAKNHFDWTRKHVIWWRLQHFSNHVRPLRRRETIRELFTVLREAMSCTDRDGWFRTKVGQISPKSDKSGTFSYHICTVWDQYDPI